MALEQTAAADGDDPAPVEVQVEDDPPRPPPGATALDAGDVQAFPATSPDQLLQAQPGLHLSAHGGRGKAFQLFFRGFDAAHGADIAVDVEGVPLNEPGNIHGHGYLDLNVVPLALVEGFSVRPGAGSASDGDLTIAASAQVDLGLADPGLVVAVDGGTDLTGSLGLAWRPPGAGSHSFVVADVAGGRGAGDARSFAQTHAALGWGTVGGLWELRAWLLGLHAGFDSPGVVREEDVEAGTIDLLGSYDGFDGGGRSQRLLGAVAGGVNGETWRSKATLWAGARSLDLYQDFTGFLRDPVDGDGTWQAQRTLQAGGLLDLRWLGPVPLLGLAGGLEARADRLDQEEREVLGDRTPGASLVAAELAHQETAAWAEAALGLPERVEVEPGVRAVLFRQTSLETVVAGQPVPSPELSVAWTPAVLPKLAVMAWPGGGWRLLAEGARGYRSAEPRGVPDGTFAPLVLADHVQGGAGLGGARFDLSLVAFWVRVDDELVFDHTAGRFLSSGSTRRLGAELASEVELVDPVHLALELTWADGRYRATGDPIPYAPRLLAGAALVAQELPLAGGTVVGSLRLRLLGPRPLTQGFQSRPTVLSDLGGSWARGHWELGLRVENPTVVSQVDGEFVFASCWDPDQAAAGACSDVPALHLTAADPLSAHVSIAFRP